MAAATLALSGTASAAVIETWTLPSDEPFFDLMTYSLGHLSGRYNVTLTSTRAFSYYEAHTWENIFWTLTPMSGPGLGTGGRTSDVNLLELRPSPFELSLDFYSLGDTVRYGCCWPSGDELVPFEETYLRETMLWTSVDFVPGDDPITITVSLSALPEPTTWGLMIVGFGLTGSALRRSRKPAVLS